MKSNRTQFFRSLAVRSVASCALLVLLHQPSSAQQQLTSLEEATSIAEQLMRQRQDPLRVALERVEAARISALDAEFELSAHQLSFSSGNGSTNGSTNGDGQQAVVEQPAAFEEYARAIAALARTPDRRSLVVIDEAAHHSDPQIRHAAMTVLREGASIEDPRSSALISARALVLSDPSARVRRQAFEAYCRWAPDHDVLALAQELGRTPGPVRDLAVREWIRIEQERNSR